MSHTFCVLSIYALLAFAHSFEAVSGGDGSLTVRRCDTDVESNKACPTCRMCEDVSRASTRRGREKTKNLRFGMWVTAAQKSQHTIACFVVTFGRGTRGTAEGMCTIDDTAASTNSALFGRALCRP